MASSGRLEREIDQKRPLSPTERAAANLYRTSAVLGREVSAFLTRWDLTGGQYNLLRIVRGAGAEGLGIAEIRDRLVTPVPDASRLVDRVEAAGWVERRAHPSDRRRVRIILTEEGRMLLQEMREAVEAFQAKQFSSLTEAELAQLSALLERLREDEPG